MKKIIFVSLLIIDFTFANVLNYINSIRAHSGAGKLKYSKSLSVAAKKHAIYLSINNEFTHSESPYKSSFYGEMPWNRISKAGFGSKAVVENISFKEKNYKASVDKIMATVYHRLAFLDTKVDSIGFSKYANIYVYDMGNSKLTQLCKQNYNISSSSVVDNICKDSSIQIPINIFRRSLNRVKSKSKDIIKYPYSNQIVNSIKLEDERPKFVYKKGYGLPISVIFNNRYYKDVSIKKFELKSGGKLVSSKIVTFRNDLANKLKKGTFILLPIHKLKSRTKYNVTLEVLADRKSKKLSWSFRTR